MLTIILTIPPDYPHSKLFHPRCCLLLLEAPVMSLSLLRGQTRTKRARDEGEKSGKNESHSSAICVSLGESHGINGDKWKATHMERRPAYSLRTRARFWSRRYNWNVLSNSGFLDQKVQLNQHPGYACRQSCSSTHVALSNYYCYISDGKFMRLLNNFLHSHFFHIVLPASTGL